MAKLIREMLKAPPGFEIRNFHEVEADGSEHAFSLTVWERPTVDGIKARFTTKGNISPSPQRYTIQVRVPVEISQLAVDRIQRDVDHAAQKIREKICEFYKEGVGIDA